ncbi:MAG TPA: hypothetical protein VF352_08125, partial [Anaerolineales bacterium]
MTMFISIFKKFGLAALVLAIGLAALPAARTSAVGLQDETTSPANQPANGVVPVPAKQSRFSHGTRGGVVPVPALDTGRLEQIWARA